MTHQDLHDTSTMDPRDREPYTHPENMEAPRTDGGRGILPSAASAAGEPVGKLLLSEIVGPRVKTWSRRADYKTTLMTGYLISFVVLLLLFNANLGTSRELNITLVDQEVVELEEIEQTQQQMEAPPPPRVPIPIEVPDDQLLDDVLLDLDAALDINDHLHLPSAPPPPPAETERRQEMESEIFFVVEEMPEIIGGTARLYELLTYPEMARLAGLEGLVVVQVTVEPDGRATSPQILRRAGPGLDEAAMEAVMKLSFKPGKQRGQPVRVRFNVPVRFRLSGGR